MKRVHLALWVAVTLMFVACETNLTQPIYVQDSVIESVDYSLAKQPIYVAELDSFVPSGTIYGPLNDSTVVDTATGGELIPTEYWVNNYKSSSYETHLYANVKVGFKGLTSVSIASPVNLDYLNASDQWIGILSNSTVSVKAIRTGDSGSGSITVDTGFDTEKEDGGAGQ